MAVRRCPECGLINPETAVACDCGWSFVREAMGTPLQLSGSEDELRRDRRSRATRQLVVGTLMLLFGISAGIYLIASSPIMSSDHVDVIEAAEKQLSKNLLAPTIFGIIGMIQIIRGRRSRHS